MKRFIGLLLVIAMAGAVFGATARNMYSTPRATYVTTAETVTFPYESECFIVINYSATSTLEVTIGGATTANTAEVDPFIGSTMEFRDFGVSSIKLRAKGGVASAETVSASVIVLY